MNIPCECSQLHGQHHLRASNPHSLVVADSIDGTNDVTVGLETSQIFRDMALATNERT